tara:strand:- start:1612 stop:2715 length:1104 start_codon:yes stop_codon:yes gene_type:complete
MKILIVIDSLGSGGAQRIAAYLAQGLYKKDHLVEVFVYNDRFNFFKSDFERFNIKIHTVKNNFKSKNKILRALNILLSLRQIIGNYDGIVAFMHLPSIYSAISKIGISKGKLAVFELSSSIAPVPKYKRILFYLSCLLSDTVITNSHTETKIMQKKLGLAKKSFTIWNGYNVEKMQPKYSTNNGKIKSLLIVGRIAYPKNGVNLLKGLNIFLNKHGWLPNVVWAGREDNDRRSVIMQNNMKEYLLMNPNLSRKFNFIGEVKDINSFYNSTDALIHPSIYEGLPNVICEAMILGCCVIASNVCDHPLILNNKRGILFDPKFPSSISEAIESFNKLSIKRRNEMAINARRFSEENFSLDKMVESFENLF